MAESNWMQHSLNVGVFEFRRSLWTIYQDKVRFAFMSIGVLLTSLIFAAFTHVFTNMMHTLEALPAPEQLRGTIVLFWLFAVFLIASRIVSARSHIDAEPLMLTTVSARTVAGGLLVAETLRALATFGLPALVLTGALGSFFNSPVSLILVPTAAFLFLATAVVTGAVFGYAVVLTVATSQFVAHHKTVLGYAASFIMIGGFYLFFFPQIGGISQASLAWIPIGWLVDLVVVGTPLIESPFYPAGVLLSSTVLLIIGGVIIEREVIALWYTDAVGVDTERSTHEADIEHANVSGMARRDALAAAVKPLVVPRIVPVSTRRVAEWTLLRTRRDSHRLMFLLLPLFIIGSSLINIGLQSGALRTLAAPICTVILPWFIGSLFALNPLGDEGAMLPVTLTAVSGSQYVRGLIAPGLLFGLPVVIVVTSIAGVFSPYTPLEQVGLVALSVYLTCIAVTITPAIGMALPRFSAISVGQRRDILPPRMSATILHMTLILIPGALLTLLVITPRIARLVLTGLVGFLARLLMDFGEPLSTVATGLNQVGNRIQTLEILQLQITIGGVLLIGGMLILALLYRNAIYQFERYPLSNTKIK